MGLTEASGHQVRQWCAVALRAVATITQMAGLSTRRRLLTRQLSRKPQRPPHPNGDENSSDCEYADIAKDADVADIHVSKRQAQKSGQRQNTAQYQKSPDPLIKPSSLKRKC